MTGQPAAWRGTWVAGLTYQQGEIVYSRTTGAVFISRIDANTGTLPVPEMAAKSPWWVLLGAIGAMPSAVTHAWNAKELRYPVDVEDGVMSEVAWVCSDCWKDGDFKNAFLPTKHFYVIKELEYG